MSILQFFLWLFLYTFIGWLTWHLIVVPIKNLFKNKPKTQEDIRIENLEDDHQYLTLNFRTYRKKLTDQLHHLKTIEKNTGLDFLLLRLQIRAQINEIDHFMQELRSGMIYQEQINERHIKAARMESDMRPLMKDLTQSNIKFSNNKMSENEL